MGMGFLGKIRKGLYRLSDDTLYDINDIQDEISTNSQVLNFIINCRSLRTKSELDIIKAFEDAYNCNNNTAIKALFYVRDIKSGLGERRVFRVLINYLAKKNPDIIKKNLKNITIYGRYDDLYSLFNTPLENDVIELFKAQIKLDLKSDNPSTLCKWLKSENCSSNASKKLGIRTRCLLGYSSREYRKLLSLLRNKIFIVERELSNKTYNNIDYNKVTYQNIVRYRGAFIRHDKINYQNYLENYVANNLVSKNFNQDISIIPIITDIINNIISKKSKNIYPYNKLWELKLATLKSIESKDIVILNIENNTNINSSLALKSGISYILINKILSTHKFKNYYMYFNNLYKPKFGKVPSGNIFEEVSSVFKNNCKRLNNVTQLLELMLFTAIKKDYKQCDLPERVVIISDKDNSLSEELIDYDALILAYNKSGYTFPQILIWYPDIKSVSLYTEKNKSKVLHGFSEDLILDVLSKRYEDITSMIIDTLHSEQYKKVLT